MEFRKVFFNIGLFLASVTAIVTEQCNEKEFKMCVAQVSDFAEGYSFSATSELLLKENCKSKLEAIDCIKEFVQKCMKQGERDVFSITTGPKFKMVEQLCTDGTKVNTGYLGNIECWNKITNDTLFCNEKFEQSQHAIHNDDLVDRLRIFHSCCAFDWHRKCKVRATERRCNARASSFMDYISTLLGGEVLKKLCTNSFPNCVELYGVVLEGLENEMVEDVSNISNPSFLLTSFLLLLSYFLAIKNH